MKVAPVLYIFGGLPASGKTTLSRHLAQTVRAAYIRIDSIEEAILASGELLGPEGYNAAYTLATDNLENGVSVVADSVNPIEITRKEWRRVAEDLEVQFKEVHVICSDGLEHQERLTKRSLDNPSIRKLEWKDIENRRFDQWQSAYCFDTAGEIAEQSKLRFLEEMKGFF